MTLCASICWPSSQDRVTSVNSLSFLNFPKAELTFFLKSFHCRQSFSDIMTRRTDIPKFVYQTDVYIYAVDNCPADIGVCEVLTPICTEGSLVIHKGNARQNSYLLKYLTWTSVCTLYSVCFEEGTAQKEWETTLVPAVTAPRLSPPGHLCLWILKHVFILPTLVICVRPTTTSSSGSEIVLRHGVGVWQVLVS